MKVFIVHAAKQKNKVQILCDFIKELGHTPIIMSKELPCGDLTNKFLNLSKECEKAIVLYTLDNKQWIKKDKFKKVARENVIFELGYFIALFSFKNTLVVKADSKKNDLPSDIGNIETVKFSKKKKTSFYKTLDKFLNGSN